MFRIKQNNLGKNEDGTWKPIEEVQGNSQCLPFVNFQFYDTDLDPKFKDMWVNPKRKTDTYEYVRPPVEVLKGEYDMAFVAKNTSDAVSNQFIVVMTCQM